VLKLQAHATRRRGLAGETENQAIRGWWTIGGLDRNFRRGNTNVSAIADQVSREIRSFQFELEDAKTASAAAGVQSRYLRRQNVIDSERAGNLSVSGASENRIAGAGLGEATVLDETNGVRKLKALFQIVRDE
jgi:hypothetical protein